MEGGLVETVRERVEWLLDRGAINRDESNFLTLMAMKIDKRMPITEDDINRLNEIWERAQ